MQHTVSEMFQKIKVMKDMAEQAHMLKYGSNDPDNYDVAKVTHLVESIQAMCGDIYNDRTLHPKLKTKQEELAWEIHENTTE
jgi:hypothetical protein